MVKKIRLGILVLLFSIIAFTGCSSDKKDTATQEPPKQEATVQTDTNTKEVKKEESEKEVPTPVSEEVKKEPEKKDIKTEKLKSAEEYKKILEDTLNEEDKITSIKVDSEKEAIIITMSLKNSTPLTDVDIAKTVYSQISDKLLDYNEIKSIKVIFENIGELELSTNYKKVNEYNLPYFPALLIDEKFKVY